MMFLVTRLADNKEFICDLIHTDASFIYLMTHRANYPTVMDTVVLARDLVTVVTMHE